MGVTGGAGRDYRRRDDRGGEEHTAKSTVLESLGLCGRNPFPYRPPAAPPAGPPEMDLRPVTDPLRSLLYVAGGWTCLGLAVLGAVLPVLPTTPFVLLASWCFYRGSPRIHAWLHRSRWFGPTLDDWHHYHGIRRSLKHRAILMVLAVVITTLFFNALPWYLQYLTIALVSYGLYTIWTVPTLPDDAPRAPRTIPE